MVHIVSINLINNQVNDVVNNELKFDYNYSLANDDIKDPQSVVTFDLKASKKMCVTYSAGLT